MSANEVTNKNRNDVRIARPKSHIGTYYTNYVSCLQTIAILLWIPISNELVDINPIFNQEKKTLLKKNVYQTCVSCISTT